MQKSVNLFDLVKSFHTSISYLLVNIGFDTAENEPLKVWRCFNSCLQFTPHLREERHQELLPRGDLRRHVLAALGLGVELLELRVAAVPRLNVRSPDGVEV